MHHVDELAPLGLPLLAFTDHAAVHEAEVTLGRDQHSRLRVVSPLLLPPAGQPHVFDPLRVVGDDVQREVGRVGLPAARPLRTSSGPHLGPLATWVTMWPQEATHYNIGRKILGNCRGWWWSMCR
jgi:hypothetical protein